MHHLVHTLPGDDWGEVGCKAVFYQVEMDKGGSLIYQAVDEG